MFEQFWATEKVKTVNEEVQIQALVDKKKVIITETSIRRDLQLADENGTECLPNATIFAELERISAKTTAWNEFTSTMASAIICLAINQRFNFSKYIFDNMVKNLEGGAKFLMYPREKTLDTPLFQTMIVQAQEEGEGSVMPTVPQHTPTINPPSTSKPQKKQSRKKQRKDTEVSQPSDPTEPIVDETKNVETYHKELLLWVGRSAQVVSSEDEGLGAQEDASKQARKLADLDADAEEVEVEKVVCTAEVTTVSATTTTVEELALAQTLIEIKAAKPKAVTTTATTTTTAVTRPKARGVVVQEPSEFRTTTSSSQTSQLPQAKDKGNAKIVEPEKPLKKKDQILIDEEIAQRLQEELQAELEEEERLARQKEEDANIAEWDNVQAMIDADYELATRLQAQEQEELTIEERSKMFMELMYKRKKHFVRLRAEEQRRKPPTKAQKRSQMSTYLKHMVGYKQNQLKSKNYDEIQKLFDKAMTRVNMFVGMDTELVKESSKKAEMVQESSSKRVGEELEFDNSKKQKLDKNVEAEVDDEAEIKKHI
ncbi:hypothetical protein Tco_1412938 [Tanacetum coccineum]